MDDLERLYRLSPPSREAALWLHGLSQYTHERHGKGLPHGGPRYVRAVETDSACAPWGTERESLGGNADVAGRVGAARCDIDAQRRELVVAREPHSGRPSLDGRDAPTSQRDAWLPWWPAAHLSFGCMDTRWVDLRCSCLSPGSSGVLDVPQGASAACYFWYRGRASGCKGLGRRKLPLPTPPVASPKRTRRSAKRERGGSQVRFVRARQAACSLASDARQSGSNEVRAARCASGGLCPDPSAMRE